MNLRFLRGVAGTALVFGLGGAVIVSLAGVLLAIVGGHVTLFELRTVLPMMLPRWAVAGASWGGSAGVMFAATLAANARAKRWYPPTLRQVAGWGAWGGALVPLSAIIFAVTKGESLNTFAPWMLLIPAALGAVGTTLYAWIGMKGRAPNECGAIASGESTGLRVRANGSTHGRGD